MTHPAEEQLVLHYYGEAENPSETAAHLAACGQCRIAFENLQRVLATFHKLPVPERSESYGTEVWRRLRPLLETRRSSGWMFPAHRWALAGTVALLVITAFLAGRFSPRQPPQAYTPPPDLRERILLVAVGEHLEQSQMILMELRNARPQDRVDISGEQERAEDLISANRLFRQTASGSGDAAVAALLEELERVLLEIAHSPAEVSRAELGSIRRRIEEEGILFKVRVLGSTLRERGASL